MLNTTKLITFALISVTTSFTAKAEFNNNSNLLCEYVASENISAFNLFIKNTPLSFNQIFDDLTCNNKNILLFSDFIGSEKTGVAIIQNINKEQLTLNYSKLTNPALIMTAKNIIQK